MTAWCYSSPTMLGMQTRRRYCTPQALVCRVLMHHSTTPCTTRCFCCRVRSVTPHPIIPSYITHAHPIAHDRVRSRYLDLIRKRCYRNSLCMQITEELPVVRTSGTSYTCDGLESSPVSIRFVSVVATWVQQCFCCTCNRGFHIFTNSRAVLFPSFCFCFP